MLSVSTNSHYADSIIDELLIVGPNALYIISDSDIHNFIKYHHYDTKYGLTVYDVRQDLEALVSEGAWVEPEAKKSTIWQDNEEYRQALQSAIKKYFPEAATDIQIRVQIRRNRWDIKYGLDSDTIISDIHAVQEENGPRQFMLYADSPVKKECATVDCILQSRDISSVARPLKRIENTTYSFDSEFINSFSEALSEHMNIIHDKKRLSALIMDVFPKFKRDSHVLIQALNS